MARSSFSWLAATSLLLALPSLTLCHGEHGDHGQAPLVASDADWTTRHMAEEHHISSFDAGSFFTLHDYDSSGQWTDEDIRRTYGLFDESTREVSQEKKDEVVRTVLDMFDEDGSGTISHVEYTKGVVRGLTLPDFGLGPGHHGDDEYEYEIHHFEKYHGDDTKLEDLTHPEDIEHFRKHEEMEEAAARLEQMDRIAVVEANIPQKFRRL